MGWKTYPFFQILLFLTPFSMYVRTSTVGEKIPYTSIISTCKYKWPPWELQAKNWVWLEIFLSLFLKFFTNVYTVLTFYSKNRLKVTTSLEFCGHYVPKRGCCYKVLEAIFQPHLIFVFKVGYGTWWHAGLDFWSVKTYLGPQSVQNRLILVKSGQNMVMKIYKVN